MTPANKIYFIHFNSVYKRGNRITHRRRLIEAVQENRNCISSQDRRNLHRFRTGRCELRPCYFRTKSIANFLLCRSTKNRRRRLTRMKQSCSRTNNRITNFKRERKDNQLN
jgi:hypothetical protein